MTEDKQGRRAAPVVLAVALGVLATLPGTGEAQRPEVRVFQDAPAALWISPPDVPGDAFGVFHFRRAFELSAPPERFVVHVSADNRYRLYVNGRQVSSGPQRSDLMHWRYETVDLAPHLRAGRNVLAALVWNWGKERPVAQFSRRTAFLLQGDSGREAVVNTGPEWKVLHNTGYAPIPVRIQDYYASPPGEAVDGRPMPWGWEEIGYSDDTWKAATAAEERVGPDRAPRGQSLRGSGRLAARPALPATHGGEPDPLRPRAAGGGDRAQRRLPARQRRPGGPGADARPCFSSTNST